MAALLVVSDRCEYCGQTIEFIKNNPILMPLVNVHNITTLGLPKDYPDIKRVPTLITSKGQAHVGIEVIRWLEMNVPCTFEGNPTCGTIANFDEPFDGVGDGFPLDAYGISLQPPITSTLQQKIDRPIKEAYSELKKNEVS
jgi:hypothetical protein